MAIEHEYCPVDRNYVNYLICTPKYFFHLSHEYLSQQNELVYSFYLNYIYPVFTLCQQKKNQHVNYKEFFRW